MKDFPTLTLRELSQHLLELAEKHGYDTPVYINGDDAIITLSKDTQYLASSVDPNIPPGIYIQPLDQIITAF